jgi:hypothetical protein
MKESFRCILHVELPGCTLGDRVSLRGRVGCAAPGVLGGIRTSQSRKHGKNIGEILPVGASHQKREPDRRKGYRIRALAPVGATNYNQVPTPTSPPANATGTVDTGRATNRSQASTLTHSWVEAIIRCVAVVASFIAVKAMLMVC